MSGRSWQSVLKTSSQTGECHCGNSDESGAEFYRHNNGQHAMVNCSVYRQERGLTDRLLTQNAVKFIVQSIYHFKY